MIKHWKMCVQLHPTKYCAVYLCIIIIFFTQ